MEGSHERPPSLTTQQPPPPPPFTAQPPPVGEIEANHRATSLKEGNTLFCTTVFNGINSVIGCGVLLVPYALALTGWFALILFFVIAMTTFYTGVLIRRCMEVDPNIKSYSDIGEYAFGRIGQVVVSILLFADLYMVDTSFLILEGDNLHKMFPKVAMRLFGMQIKGKSIFVIIVAIILLPTVWLDNLGIPALYTSMQKKQHFSCALLLSFIFGSTIYVSMAVSGYLMFGTQSRSQITLNLPTDKISSQVAIYTTSLTPLAKYAFVLKPVVIALESWFPTKYRMKWYFKITIRTALVATQVFVALALPFFGDLMSLVGALLSTTTSLTIPCMCYLKISSSSSSSQWQVYVERIFIWCIIILSVVIVILGTYTSVVHLIEKLSK